MTNDRINITASHADRAWARHYAYRRANNRAFREQMATPEARAKNDDFMRRYEEALKTGVSLKQVAAIMKGEA